MPWSNATFAYSVPGGLGENDEVRVTTSDELAEALGDGYTDPAGRLTHPFPGRAGEEIRIDVRARNGRVRDILYYDAGSGQRKMRGGSFRLPP